MPPSFVSTQERRYGALIQAAKCGLGLANVPRMLVRDELRIAQR